MDKQDVSMVRLANPRSSVFISGLLSCARYKPIRYNELLAADEHR